MKATLSTFKQLASSHGIEVQYDKGYVSPKTGRASAYYITLTAPVGKVFNTSLCDIDCSINGEINGEVGEHAVYTKADWGADLVELQDIIDKGFDEADE